MLRAKVDLPTPLGPASTTLVASLRKSSEINSSTAARSHRLGHAQSKSHMGLKRPMWASRRRRSRLRRARSSSSHCNIESTQSAVAMSDQWASRPCSCSAFARRRRDSRLFIVAFLQLVIAVEWVWLYRVIPLLHVLGQAHLDRRREMEFLATALQRQAHCVGVRHAALERILNGDLQPGGPIAIKQTQQGCCDGSEVVATCCGAGEQYLAGGGRLGPAIGAAMPTRLAFVLDQRLDMGTDLDLFAAV